MPLTTPPASRPRDLLSGRIKSPLGEILIVVDETETLRALDFADFEDRMVRLLGRHYGDLARREAEVPGTVSGALEAYFDGELKALEPLSVATHGTDFQRTVWAALRTIPTGQTDSYKGLAGRINRPTAMRAVGLANGANPIALVVPCHRVIGAGGSLTGYAGGLARKAWLLKHETVVV